MQLSVRISLLLLSVLLLRAAQMYKIFHTPDVSKGKSCRALGDTAVTAPSVEDFRFLSPTLVVASNGYVLEFIDIGHASRNGTLVLVDLESETTRTLELSGFPTEQYGFKPHGIDYMPETGLLYVINHAITGDRVDIFSVSYPTSFSWCSLTYQSSVPLSTVPAGTANSLVAMSQDEILVTHWLPFAVPPEGMDKPATLSSRLKVLKNYGNIVGGKALGLPAGSIGRTFVVKCAVKTGKCETATKSFLSSNGITKSPDSKYVFVVDCMRGDVTAFSRDPATGVLTHIVTQLAPYTADNAQMYAFDNGSYVLQFGTIVSSGCVVMEKLTHDHRPCPGGLMTGTFDPIAKKFTFRVDMTHDGHLLGAVATAASVNGGAGGNIILGGPRAKGGMLVCPQHQ